MSSTQSVSILSLPPTPRHAPLVAFSLYRLFFFFLSYLGVIVLSWPFTPKYICVPTNGDSPVHNSSTVIHFRKLNIDTMLLGNLPSILQFCQLTRYVLYRILFPSSTGYNAGSGLHPVFFNVSLVCFNLDYSHNLSLYFMTLAFRKNAIPFFPGEHSRLIFSYDYIQVLHFCPGYYINVFVSFLRCHIGRHLMSI